MSEKRFNPCKSCLGTGIDRVEGCSCLHGLREGKRPLVGTQEWTIDNTPYVYGALTVYQEIEVRQTPTGRELLARVICPDCESGDKEVVWCDACAGSGTRISEENP